MISPIDNSPRLLLGADPAEIIAYFGGNYAISAFAADEHEDALPVLLPVHAASNSDPTDLTRTLASMASVSAHGKTIRPLVLFNGCENAVVTNLESVCDAFGLSPNVHIRHYEQGGKVRTLQAAVRVLLEEEDYVGPFATVDDDTLMPIHWSNRVVEYMRAAKAEAVGGGTLTYYRPSDVPRSVLLARNIANTAAERTATIRGNLRVHGNNHWFNATSDGLVAQAFDAMDPCVGVRGDVYITDVLRTAGVEVLPTDTHPDGHVLTEGDRTKSFKDLFRTAIGNGARRYMQDPAWAK